MDHARRQLLILAGIAPLALLVRGTAQAQGQTICYDPATLPLAQKRQRRALGYVEISVDQARRCGLCAFFTPGGNSKACGTCQLVSGGPVAAISVCNSYAPRSR
jgi:hypothetical protein